MDSEDVVRSYIAAVAANDFEAMTALRHPDWYEDWPQSGERVPSDAAYRRIHENYPGGIPEVEIRDIAGAEDRWVMTPSMTVQRIAGSGDHWIMEGTNTYAGGDLYYVVGHVHLLGGRVWRVTTYFAEPFPASPDRAPFTVPIPEAG